MTNASDPIENGTKNIELDDDGLPTRKGTLSTAIAHIITAVIGSGVLSLAWAVAQMGWVAGPIVLAVFSIVTWYAASMLCDCYRDQSTGKRHYTYKEAVRRILGGRSYLFLALAQYSIFVGAAIGYTLTASVSMAAVDRSICFHQNGHKEGCHTSNNKYTIMFGVIQLFLSQLPNFHKLSWLSMVATVMSFSYSLIGIGLSIAKVAGGSKARTSLTGVQIGIDVTSSQKIWGILTALGNMAFAYAFSMVLVEIQDTLKSSPPENIIMKKAVSISIVITTAFYLLCGVIGYAAFGNDAPGNFLTGFGFYEPFWLIALANIFIVIHLVGAYQVFCQPLFDFVETHSSKIWAKNTFIIKEYNFKIPIYGAYDLNWFRLLWRTIFVIVVSLISMIFPFFNDFVGLIGSISFWPITIYFPIEMFIVQRNVPRFSGYWIWLKLVSLLCLIVSLVATIASVRGLIVNVTTYKLFHFVS